MGSRTARVVYAAAGIAAAVAAGACATPPRTTAPRASSFEAAATRPSICEILPSCDVAPDLVAELEQLMSRPAPAEPPVLQYDLSELSDEDFRVREAQFTAYIAEEERFVDWVRPDAAQLHDAITGRLGTGDDATLRAYLGLLLEDLAAVGFRCFEPASGECPAPEPNRPETWWTDARRDEVDPRRIAAIHFARCAESQGASGAWRDFCASRRDALTRQLFDAPACTDAELMRPVHVILPGVATTHRPEPLVTVSADGRLYADEQVAWLEALARSEPALGSLLEPELARRAQASGEACPRSWAPLAPFDDAWASLAIECGVEQCDAVLDWQDEHVQLVARVVDMVESEAEWIAAFDRPLRFRTDPEGFPPLVSRWGAPHFVNASDVQRVTVELADVPRSIHRAAERWAAGVRDAVRACRIRPGERLDARLVASVDEDGRMVRHELVDSRGRPDPEIFSCIGRGLGQMPSADGPARHRIWAWIRGSDAALTSFAAGEPHVRLERLIGDDPALLDDATESLASVARHGALTECLASADVHVGAVCARIDETGRLVDLRFERGRTARRPARVLAGPGSRHADAEDPPECLRDFVESVRWSCGPRERTVMLRLERTTREDASPWSPF